MDLQKEKHEYLSMLVDHGAITQEQSDSLSLLNSNIGLHSNSLTSSLVDCINWGWQSWLKAKAQAVPEWAVIVPRLSANYLFNKVPELGFKHQDEKDTVLYHLNYMASGFKESAKQLVEDNHAKQKAMIEAQEQSHD